MNRIKLIGSAIAAMAIMAGCTPEEQMLAMQTMGTLAGGGMAGGINNGGTVNNGGVNQNTASYQQGGQDGCRTKQTGAVTRDQNKYSYDANYKAGWNAGYSQCTVQQNTNTNTNTNNASYQQGGQDGCKSKQTGTLTQDKYKYGYDANYKAGWNAGYSQCTVQQNTNSTAAASYQQGQQDGCWTAQYGQAKQDKYKYGYDANYKNGWDKGYSACRR